MVGPSICLVHQHLPREVHRSHFVAAFCVLRSKGILAQLSYQYIINLINFLICFRSVLPKGQL